MKTEDTEVLGRAKLSKIKAQYSRMEKAAWTIRLLQPSVSDGVDDCLLAMCRIFCGVIVVQCVKLMLIIVVFGVLLFDSFVYRQNVTYSESSADDVKK